MKTFLVPSKYTATIPVGLKNLGGSLIFPAGVAAPTLERRKIKKASADDYRLLDPQLYLAQLVAVVSRKACANLASYPWFLADSGFDYDSAEQDQKTYIKALRANVHRYWNKASFGEKGNVARVVSAAIQSQVALSCTGVLIPTPLIVEQSSDLTEFVTYLDAGLDAAETFDLKLPLYATVSISDSALRGVPADRNSLLAMIIDQVTSRRFAGAYIVIEQTSEPGYYCTHPNTVGALLYIVWGLKVGGIKTVVVGPVGNAGFLSLAAGADVWSTGWYRGERRIRLQDMDDSTGRSTPTYYSHRLASEIHTEHDLDVIGGMDLFEEIVDVTADSEGLIDALEMGVPVSKVPEWAYSLGNVSAAKKHFIRSVASATYQISKLAQPDVTSAVHQWIAGSEELAVRLSETGNFHSRTELRHQSAWLQALVDFRKFAGV